MQTRRRELAAKAHGTTGRKHAQAAKGQLAGDERSFLRSSKRPSATYAASYRIVDLFAGCGGLTLGAGEAAASLERGLEVVLAAEIDPVIRAVYAANFPRAQLDSVGDVTKLIDGEVGEPLTIAERRVVKQTGSVDLLVGGPPCQGHSNLNNHTRSSDARNVLYRRMARAAEVLKPACIAIENVPGVLRDRGGIVERVVKDLVRLGYQVDHGIVDMSNLGVAQLRVRHVLLASRYAAPSLDRLVRENKCRTRHLRWAIADLATRKGDDLLDTAPVLSEQNAKRARWLLDNEAYDLPNKMRPPCHRDKPDHKYKSMYGRLRWDLPAQTITTGFLSPGQGRYLHPDHPRTLTPHEAARIQFFPDWFSFAAAPTRAALAHCIGNAVPPKLGYAIARELLPIAEGLRADDQGDAASNGVVAMSGAD